MKKIAPPVFERPDHSLNRVMSLLGEEFALASAEYWHSPGSSGYRDPDDGWINGEPESVKLAKKNPQGVWEISTIGANNLLAWGGRFGFGKYGKCFPKSVLEEVASSEQKKEVLDLFEKEQVEVIENFRSSVSIFWSELRKFKEFFCLDPEVQEKLQRLSLFQDLADCEREEGKLHLFFENEWREAQSLHLRQQAGEIAVNFGGRYRRMGTSNNSDFWVIAGDGQFVDPSRIKYRPRHKEEGEKKWRVVEGQELAIAWKKPSAGAEHQCLVEKFPVEGITPQQQETVRDLTRLLTAQWAGVIGISGKISPSIGFGWGLSLGQKTHPPKKRNEEVVSSPSPQETTQPEKVVKKEEKGLQHNPFAQLAKLSK